MRFASKSPGFNRTVQQPLFDRVRGDSGETEMVCTRPWIMAQFVQMGITAFEKAQVAARLKFAGLGDGEDPMRRVSMYDTETAADTEAWDAETRARVEKSLLEGQSSWYFLLEEERQPKPWPRYDEIRSAQKIAETVLAQGYDPEAVIAYEREHKNREAVITALEEVSVEPEPLIAA